MRTPEPNAGQERRVACRVDRDRRARRPRDGRRRRLDRADPARLASARRRPPSRRGPRSPKSRCRSRRRPRPGSRGRAGCTKTAGCAMRSACSTPSANRTRCGARPTSCARSFSGRCSKRRAAAMPGRHAAPPRRLGALPQPPAPGNRATARRTPARQTMRCPKCHYISFGSVDRCRNCGYEFVLAVEPPPLDLPIQSGDQTIGPLGGFRAERPRIRAAGSALPESRTSGAARRPPAAVRAQRPRFDLPLFGEAADAATTRRSSRRRRFRGRRCPCAAAQPALARPRPERAPDGRRARARPASRASVDARPIRGGVPARGSHRGAGAESSSSLRRFSLVSFAGLVDVLVLGAIDGRSCTPRCASSDLPLGDVSSLLPLVPLGVFLLLLNGGYLAMFTTAGGQTIGKMLTRHQGRGRAIAPRISSRRAPVLAA